MARFQGWGGREVRPGESQSSFGAHEGFPAHSFELPNVRVTVELVEPKPPAR